MRLLAFTVAIARLLSRTGAAEGAMIRQNRRHRQAPRRPTHGARRRSRARSDVAPGKESVATAIRAPALPAQSTYGATDEDYWWGDSGERQSVPPVANWERRSVPQRGEGQIQLGEAGPAFERALAR